MRNGSGNLMRLVVYTVLCFFVDPTVLSSAENPSPVISPQSHYVSDRKSRRVIVFVHGLNGNARDTWLADSTHYWPQMISADPSFAGADVYAASYPTPVRGNHMSVNDVISYLADELQADGVFERHEQVIFVAHSLGGIAVQQLLLTYRDKNLAAKVPFIYLYATPQTGSQLANVAKLFRSDPLIKELQRGNGNFVLPRMDSEWSHSGFGSIKRYCAYETQSVKGFKVVDWESATRGCSDQVAIDANHFNIVKPADTSHRPYTALRNKFSDLLAQTAKISINSLDQRPSESPRNCQQSICIEGSNSGSLQVYNFGTLSPPPRGITNEQAKAAISLLSTAQPGTKLTLHIVGLDDEIERFARQIWAVFLESKWQVDAEPSFRFFVSYEVQGNYRTYQGEGVACYYGPDSAGAGQLTVAAMAAANIPCKVIVSSYARDISVVVGTRFIPKE